MAIDKFKDIIEEYNLGELTIDNEWRLRCIFEYKMSESLMKGLAKGPHRPTEARTSFVIIPGEGIKLEVGGEIITISPLVTTTSEK